MLPTTTRTCGWVLGTTLGALGFGVVSSPNGEQALLEVGTRRFDAVLLDVNMPGMGGIGDVPARFERKLLFFRS